MKKTKSIIFYLTCLSILLVLFQNFTYPIPTKLNGLMVCGEKCIDLSNLIIEESSAPNKSIYAQQNSQILARAISYALQNSIDEIRLPSNNLTDSTGRISGKFYIGTSFPINELNPTQIRFTNYSGRPLRIVSNNALLYFSKGDIEVRNIQFENISFRFLPTLKSDISRIYIENITMIDGFNGEYSYIPGSSSVASTVASNDHQISMVNVKGAMIYKSAFSREQNELGRGISLSSSQEIKIIRNTCKGYYVTCLNIGGSKKKDGIFPDDLRGFNIEISQNSFIRFSGGEPATATIGQEIDRRVVIEDHGIYIWGAKNISMTGNNIQGWSRTSSGNSIKLRDSENINILNNIFKTSGLSLYVHSCLPDVSCYLRNVSISGNIFSETPDDTRSTLPVLNELGKSNTSYYTVFYFYKNTSVTPTPENQIQNISISNNNFLKTNVVKPIAIYNSYNHNKCSTISINNVAGKNNPSVCLY